MFRYLTSNKEPKVEVVDVSRKIFPEEHLLPNEKTREPEVVVTRDVDVDALIQAGAPLCLDLNQLMSENPEAAAEMRAPWQAGSDVIDESAAANLKESVNSVRAANAKAKAAGFDSIESYVQNLIDEALKKQTAPTIEAEKGDN